MSIGVPYPLPFTPLQIPEEERHHSIVVCVNDLWTKNQIQDGNWEWTSKPSYPGQSSTENTFIHHPAKENNIQNLYDEELQVLITLAINTIHDRGISFSTSVPMAPKVPDIFDNAKFKHITHTRLQPKYNSSPDELIPTLNAIHIRHQNEVWYAATFIIQDNESIDLVRHFPRFPK